MDVKRASDNVAIIHGASVTPTSILLTGPESETKNRVLRLYPDNHSHFLLTGLGMFARCE